MVLKKINKKSLLIFVFDYTKLHRSHLEQAVLISPLQ